MADVADNLIEIYPPRGREHVATSMLALKKGDRYFVDKARQDDNAKRLIMMFGSEAAKKARETAIDPAPVAQVPYRPTLRLKTPAENTLALDIGASVSGEASDTQEPVRPTLNQLLMGDEGTWSWSKGADIPGAEAGAEFTVTRAWINRKSQALELTIERDVAGELVEATVSIPGNAADYESSLNSALGRLIEAANTSNREAVAETVLPAKHAAELDSAQDLFDRIIAASNGATGPAVEWHGENLDRPQTAAKTGMRAVIISGRISPSTAGSRTLKLVLDYRGFSEHNAVVAGQDQYPSSFETVTIVATAAEGSDHNSMMRKVGRTFTQVDGPAAEVSKDHMSAADQRATDERIKMAMMANNVVAQAGEEPPAPIPPVNPSPLASRVYFWTAREQESPYCYRNLEKAALEANVPLLIDRDKKNLDHWGLRYVEMTSAEAAQLPESLTKFFSENAHQAHLASKAARDSSRRLVSDAAATAAIDVVSKRPSYRDANLRPLLVPNPEHHAAGWQEARDAIDRMETGRLTKVMDLTWSEMKKLQLEDEKLATMNRRMSRDKQTRLASYTQAIGLGKKLLSEKGVKWAPPESKETGRPAKASTQSTRASQAGGHGRRPEAVDSQLKELPKNQRTPAIAHGRGAAIE